jgi:hypothetical protein
MDDIVAPQTKSAAVLDRRLGDVKRGGRRLLTLNLCPPLNLKSLLTADQGG